MDRLEHARGFAIGIEIARRRDAHAAGNRCAEIRDDVAEHIARDDHIIIFRLEHHVHAAGIDMVIFARDIRIFLADFFKRARPQFMCECEHVGLGDHRQFFSHVAFAGEFKGITQAALNTKSRGHHFLHRHFLGCSLTQKTADAAIQIFRVFADDDEINILRGLSRQRRTHTREQFHGAEIDVLIQIKSQFEQQAFFQNSRGHIGAADGSEINRVILPQVRDFLVGDHELVFEVASAAVRKLRDAIFEAGFLGDFFEASQALVGDFRADAVAADDC